MTRRALSVAALILAFSAVDARAEVPITPEARAHFAAGVNLLRDPDGARYEEAYREFQAAYAASPSYKILGNLGLCAMKLERDGEAVEFYSKYLTEAANDIQPEEKKQIETDLATIKAGVVRLTVESNVPDVTIADIRVTSRGERILNVYAMKGTKAEIGVRAGHHELTLRAPGYDDSMQPFDAGSGSKATHTFVMKKKGEGAPAASATGPVPPPTASSAAPPPPKETTRPVPTGVYIGVAATGAFAIGAAITGIMATGKKSDFDKANDGTDPSAAEDAKKSGQSLNLITDVLLAGTVVAGGVTAYLFFSRPEETAASNRLRIAPSVGSNGGGLVAVGRF
jgi:hypothetical protein